MPPTGYEKLWAILHRSLLLLAGGGTLKLDNRISAGKASSSSPPSSGEELRDLERRWEDCRTDGDRRRVLKAAYALLKAHTLPNRNPKALPNTREWREAIAHDPRSSRDVAAMYEVGKTTVLRYRKEFRVFAQESDR